MFVSGGSFILSSRTSSVKRPHQRSLAAAVLKEIKIGVIRPDKTDTSTVLIERCISFPPFTHLLELASLLRVSKKKKTNILSPRKEIATIYERQMVGWGVKKEKGETEECKEIVTYIKVATTFVVGQPRTKLVS